jgi:hypothetical protein
MIDYRIETTGSLNMTVAEVAKLLDRNVITAMNAVMVRAQKIARDPIPSGKSGIRKSIGLEKAKVGTKVAVIGTSHPKMEFVEEDTEAHTIRAKDKKVLRFKINGKFVFAKKVDHPGTEGKHSFAAADDFVERQLDIQLRNAVDATLNGKAYSPLTAHLISALQSLL